MKTFFYIVVFFVHTYLISQEKNSLELWTYTIGNFVSENAHKIVSENRPFTTKAMAGDVLIAHVIDSIEQHNNQIWIILEERGNIDSKNKYFEEVHAEEIKIKKAIDLINNNQKAIRIFNRLKKKNLQIYTQLFKIKDSIYMFDIYSYSIPNIDKSEKFEIKLVVDIESNKTLSTCHCIKRCPHLENFKIDSE